MRKRPRIEEKKKKPELRIKKIDRAAHQKNKIELRIKKKK